MTSGIDLKVERVRAGATQRDIARYMGVSAARISTIERSGNGRKTGIDPDTGHRYREAVAMYLREKQSGEPQTWRVELTRVAIGGVRDQYQAAKAQAREDVRRYPSHRTVEVVIDPETPGPTLLGYLDGLQAAGVSSVVLDGGGTIVNRRIG